MHLLHTKSNKTRHVGQELFNNVSLSNNRIGNPLKCLDATTTESLFPLCFIAYPKRTTMVNAKLFLAIAFLLFWMNNAFSQQPAETLIRKYENMEREAILKNDTAQLSRLLSRKIVVQNPENSVVGFRQIIDRIKGGKINYSTFERQIDRVAFLNGIAVVMGLETLIPQGATQHAGKTVKRRFTNVWTKEDGTWKLTARQATIVSIN